MKIKKDKKYWEDYTEFINQVEKLTDFSPSDLLSRYETLSEELKDVNQDFYLEWRYEIDYDLITRHKIEKVINHRQISENILLQEFKQKIESLDLEIKKHILNSDQKDWWKNIQLKAIQK